MEFDYKLMEETLENAYEYIPNVIAAIGNMAYNLQGGREDKAIPVCTNLFEGLKWLTDTFLLTKPFQVLRGREITTGEVYDINIQIEESLENRDYVLLGDLLQYELLPIVEKWNEEIAKILGKQMEN